MPAALRIIVLGLTLLSSADPWAVAQEVDDSPPAPRVEDTDVNLELEQLRARIGILESEQRRRSDAESHKQARESLKPTVKWSGQLQMDTYWFDQDAASKEDYGDIQNGEAIRRARLAMFGDYGPADYRLEMEFAFADRPTFLDVWTGFHDLPILGRVRVGHFFEPFSLERLTSNRFTTYMERNNPDQAFAPARNLGIAAGDQWSEDHGTWAIGWFRSSSDSFTNDVGDSFENAATGRLTRLLWYDDATGAEYLHLGAAYSFRGTNAEMARFRSQPEARVGSSIPNVPFFVDTGFIPSDHYQLVGFEAAWVHGPFMIQSEYMLTPVDRIDLPSVLFTGGYVSCSWFLTGEHRPYLKSNGTFDRVIPRRDFLRYQAPPCVEFGPGAWELAFRVSHVDLNDDTVQGGRLTDVTLGLNWYLSRYSRITSNWVHAIAKSPDGIESNTNIFAVRMGFEF